MDTLITILHVVVSLILMLTVLLQSGKGGMGGAFGGGSSTGAVFGGSGAGGFLRKLTAGCAVFFMLTSMTLAWLASNTGADALKRYSAQQRRAKQLKDAAKSDALGGTNTPLNVIDAGAEGDDNSSTSTPDGDKAENPDGDKADKTDGDKADGDKTDKTDGDKADGDKTDKTDKADKPAAPKAAPAPKTAPAKAAPTATPKPKAAPKAAAPKTGPPAAPAATTKPKTDPPK